MSPKKLSSTEEREQLVSQQSENCHTCVGMPSQAHQDIVVKLSKIEAGQEYLCRNISEMNKALAKISVQEERQINMQASLDAAWIKIDALRTGHDRCPIANLKTQVNWIWVFLSGLALGLTMLFVTGVVKGP